MSLGNLNNKCRICLTLEEEMVLFHVPLYRLDNIDPTVYSLSELLKCITRVEIEEISNIIEYACGTCTKTILNFNKLLKTLQNNQYYLQQLLLKKEEIENKEFQTEMDFLTNPENGIEDSNFRSCEEMSEPESDNLKYEAASDDEDTSFNMPETLPETKSLNNSSIEITSKKYTCEECGDVFLIKTGFSQHMMMKHKICVQLDEFDQYSSKINIKMPENYSKNVLKFVSKTQSTPRTSKFQCSICRSKFSSGNELKLHKEIHRVHTCEICGAAFIKSSYLKDHLLMHSSQKMFSCDVCGKTFRYRNGLSVHKTVHENYRGHQCETCGQGFNARSTLQTHIRLKHTNVTKFPCSECNLSFKEKSWLNKHFQRKHTTNRTKDFVCSVCGIAYLNKYTLTRHMSDKHTGTPKRFYCTVCEKSYTMKNKLTVHLEKKHFLAVY